MPRSISGCLFCFSSLLSLVLMASALPAEEIARSRTLDSDDSVIRLRPLEMGIGRMIPDASFVDVAGQKHQLSDFKHVRSLVIAVTSTSCPVSKLYLPTLAELEKSYSGKAVFVFVNPLASDSDQDIRSAIATQHLAGPYIRDPEGKLLSLLDCRTTTECFILDQSRTLMYRGAVDDQYGIGSALAAPRHRLLAAALDAVLAGVAPENQATRAPGCELEFKRSASKPASVTFHNRISRIVQSNCLECHHAGGTAPFSLETYQEIVAHAPMIRRVVERGLMPPWFAAPPKPGTHSPWANDRSLAPSDKSDLLAWLQGDRAAGDPADAPVPKVFPADWQIGKPDLIIQAPEPIAVKATGVMPYQYAVVTTEFEEDLWVRGFELRPSARGVLHHASVFVEQVAWNGNGLADEKRGPFAVYVPGTSAIVYPDGYAKRLPKGASLRFQIHYAPNGTAVFDQPELGLLLSKTPPQHVIHGTAVVNPYIQIPAQAENHVETGTMRVGSEIQILALLPHMHVRGKAFRYEVAFPDGKSQVLLDVPRYDFNWQIGYIYSHPLSIPGGSTIKITGWFDNSPRNAANPEPGKIVRWGPQTNDEMLLGYIEYVVPNTHAGDFAAATSASVGAGEPRHQIPDTLTPARELEAALNIRQPAGLLKVLDRNQDRKVSFEEWKHAGKRSITSKLNGATFERAFQRLDRDHDNFLTLEELGALAPR